MQSHWFLCCLWRGALYDDANVYPATNTAAIKPQQLAKATTSNAKPLRMT
jgi:hypothetical protein